MATTQPLVATLHWICAVLYVFIGALVLVRGPRSSAAWWIGAGCGATAFWSGLVALKWPTVALGLSLWLELARSLVWYGLILSLFRRSVPRPARWSSAFTVVGAALAVSTLSILLMNVLAVGPPFPIRVLQTLLHLAIPICILVLIENFYYNTPSDDRWSISLLCVALAIQFLFDIVLHADAIMSKRHSVVLYEGRVVVVIIAAPLIALAAVRNREWRVNIHISREVAFHGASLVIAGSLLVALGSVGEILRESAANWGNVVESAIVVSGMTSVVLLLTSEIFRVRFRRLLSEHFFSYRYDYRREWVRCINTLTAPGAHVNLYLRAIRAAAAVIDSPGGVVFVRAPEEVAFRWAGSWNCPAPTEPIPPGDQIVSALEHCTQTVVLSYNGLAGSWISVVPRPWIAVPLQNSGRLVGFVVLAESRVHLKLDKETLDLLRVVGSEIGSRIAEHRAAQLIVQTSQLREYSQKFSFVAHDIKNISGQLRMLLVNADAHAGNPAFQQNVLATVEAAVTKISRLLSKLQIASDRSDHTILSPGDFVLSLVSRLPVEHRARVVFRSYCPPINVAISLDIVDAIFRHLISNAMDVSGSKNYVYVSVYADGAHLAIDVADQGAGMTAEFIRDDLFMPFVSTKRNGLGIGAYQAQELARVAGGDLLVCSRVDAGTIMRVLLPIA